MSKVMKVQNGLYTLVTKGTDENDVNVRIIGSHIRYIFAPEEPEHALDVLTHPHTKIVSLTITDSVYDLKNYDKPRTVFGYIVHALDARRRANQALFTVMSCDNVQQNGELTKQRVLQFAKGLHNPQLIEYIQTKVTFPNAIGKRKINAETSDLNPRVMCTSKSKKNW